jgi:hypothetical protein
MNKIIRLIDIPPHYFHPREQRVLHPGDLIIAEVADSGLASYKDYHHTTCYLPKRYWEIAFEVGDRVRLTVERATARTWRDETLPVGTEVEIDSIDHSISYQAQAICVFMRNGLPCFVCAEHIERVSKPKGACTCSLRVLMTSGCQCGGS